MRLWLTVLFLAALTGCQASTDPVMLKNPKTGQVAQCGPYWVGLSRDFKDMSGIAAMERGCVEDYKQQGYVRK